MVVDTTNVDGPAGGSAASAGMVSTGTESDNALRDAEREAMTQALRAERSEKLLHRVQAIVKSPHTCDTLAKKPSPRSGFGWLLLMGLCSGVLLGAMWNRTFFFSRAPEKFLKAWGKRKEKIAKLAGMLKKMSVHVEWDKYTNTVVKKSTNGGPARQLLKVMKANHGPIPV
jgi:hypothetical protein